MRDVRAQVRYHDIIKETEDSMAQFVVRNLEDAVKVRLQRQAKRHRRSMEEEVREILRSAAHQDEVPSGGLGSDIAALFAKVGLEAEIPELRGHRLEPVRFAK